jgi:hypothetical protein
MLKIVLLMYILLLKFKFNLLVLRNKEMNASIFEAAEEKTQSKGSSITQKY